MYDIFVFQDSVSTILVLWSEDVGYGERTKLSPVNIEAISKLLKQREGKDRLLIPTYY